MIAHPTVDTCLNIILRLGGHHQWPVKAVFHEVQHVCFTIDFLTCGLLKIVT